VEVVDPKEECETGTNEERDVEECEARTNEMTGLEESEIKRVETAFGIDSIRTVCSHFINCPK